MPFKAFSAVVGRLSLRTVTVDHIVAGDQVLDIAGGIRVIETPGHTPDHVSFFWERERVLFVGDLLRNLGKLSLTPAKITWSMDHARASAQKLPPLNPAVMCFGHGEPWMAESNPDGIKTLLTSLDSAV